MLVIYTSDLLMQKTETAVLKRINNSIISRNILIYFNKLLILLKYNKMKVIINKLMIIERYLSESVSWMMLVYLTKILSFMNLNHAAVNNNDDVSHILSLLFFSFTTSQWIFKKISQHMKELTEVSLSCRIKIKKWRHVDVILN